MASRVKQHRLAAGLSQAELANLAAISRAGLGAIETGKLSPSVTAALALAKALGATVESLFGEAAHSGRQVLWATEPARFPCRYWAAEVNGRSILYPCEGAGWPARHDGVAAEHETAPTAGDTPQRTLVIATCDPAALYLAAEYERQTPFRLIVLRRSSGQAVELLERGLIHAAGVHLAESARGDGNVAALKRLALQQAIRLLAVARWEEGLAVAPALKLRGVRDAAATKLRWIGRGAGAGARRCQDELLGERPAPKHVASDHQGVTAAIRAGFADVGVCVRLAADEAGVGFLPVCQEDYDLCFPLAMAGDPRIVSLIEVVKSNSYRRALAELPGYRVRRAGEMHLVSAATP